MDFKTRNSNNTQQPSNFGGGNENENGGFKPSLKSVRGRKPGKLLKIVYLTLLVSATVLIALALASLIFSDNRGKESKYVNQDKLQAVFLNNGQVYFGQITSLNDNYIALSNIYYLRVNQQVQPDEKNAEAANQDVSLVKLGCELHGPEDEMVINRSEVSFWENLKSDGQVAKAVEEYVKANPNGQDCSQQQGGQQPSAGPEGSAGSTANETPAANTPQNNNTGNTNNNANRPTSGGN